MDKGGAEGLERGGGEGSVEGRPPQLGVRGYYPREILLIHHLKSTHFSAYLLLNMQCMRFNFQENHGVKQDGNSRNLWINNHELKIGDL